MHAVPHLCATVVAVVCAATSTAAAQDAATTSPSCQVAGPLVRVPELPEGSGIAASKQSPGRFWALNDSGPPALVALDSQGAAVGQVDVPTALKEDWEAIAVGPCPTGSCLYVGDVGDNQAKRPEIAIYRLAEPARASGAVGHVDAFRVRYPDGAHDAEALLVTPNGDVVIVTKGDTGPVALYRLPSGAQPGAPVMLQSIGKPRESGKPAANARITDGAVSPSGAWVALRTNRDIVLYRTAELMSGNWHEAARVSLKNLGEPQGEGIAFGDESTLYLVGEGGGKAQPGTFGRVTCRW